MSFPMKYHLSYLDIKHGKGLNKIKNYILKEGMKFIHKYGVLFLTAR